MAAATTTNSRTLENEDESVRIAVRALGDMRSGRRPSTSTSAPTPPLSTASSSGLTTPTADESGSDYLARVSGMPLVTSALRASMAAYEQGKASSRVVKYGAEMVESSLSTISRPVIDRLHIGRPPSSTLRGRKSVGEDWPPADQYREPSTSPTHISSHAGHPDDALVLAQPDLSASTSASASEPASRSTWQSVLLEAGGISAAVSDEHMRRLQYVLHWLQHATARVDAQILALRALVTAQPSPAHAARLRTLQTDVVGTVREAVAVVSRYAGGALPAPARAAVRSFVLCLPQRLGRRLPREHAVGGAPAPRAHSTPYSRSASPGPLSPTSPLSPTGNAAERVLALATESLDMMRGVTAVVAASLDRADAWVGRLRAVGIQRGPEPDSGGVPAPAMEGLAIVPEREPVIKMEVDT